MNLINKFTMKELKLLNEIGIKIEDRDYNQEEVRNCELNIGQFIMAHSTKNGDVDKMFNKYNGILNTLIRI